MTSEHSRPPRVDTRRLQDIALAYWQSAALMSAVDVGVFTAVSKGARDVDALAEALDLSRTNVERLATVLLAMDLFVDGDDGFENAPDVERFLVEGERDFAGPWIHFTRPRWSEWGRLTEHLRSREEDTIGKSLASMTVEGAREYHRATFSIGLGAGRRFSRHVDLSGRSLLLDLGGGSGAYSIVAVQQNPALRAVVFDLAPVVEVTREFVAQAGVADRVSAQAGDFTADPFPSADVVLMASNLPQYSREIIARVVAKAFGALVPGGEMHLIGEMLDDERTGPIGPALWGLAEALLHSTGVAHSEADCVGYFGAAGFVDVAANEFVKGTLTRVSGTKPF